MSQRTVAHGDGTIGFEVNGLATTAGRDVARRGGLRDAVFGQQADVAGGTGYAGVEGQVGICGRAFGAFACAQQDVASGADAQSAKICVSLIDLNRTSLGNQNHCAIRHDVRLRSIRQSKHAAIIEHTINRKCTRLVNLEATLIRDKYATRSGRNT